MKNLLFTLATIFLSGNLIAQIDSFEIVFKPSFIENSQLNISRSDTGYTMNLKKSTTLENVLIHSRDFAPLENFFKDYHYNHSGNIDSIQTKKINASGDTTISNLILLGMDGITVEGNIKFDNKLKTFEFWSPKKDTENNKLIELLFELMNRNFHEKNTVEYIEDLEQYFRLGPGIKKLSKNPMVYKLYGSISSYEAEELYAFFNSLPTETEVIIDLSNFHRMGSMFDEDFLEFTRTHPKVKFENCSEPAKKMLKRAGIKQ